jgi:hypothetical protein
LVHQLLNQLARALQLLRVPAEGSGGHQILVRGLFFAIFHLKHVCINLFLVYVAAAFVVEDEGDGGGELAFPPILNLAQLPDGLRDGALLENTEGSPEGEDCVLAFCEFLKKKAG